MNQILYSLINLKATNCPE